MREGYKSVTRVSRENASIEKMPVNLARSQRIQPRVTRTHDDDVYPPPFPFKNEPHSSHEGYRRVTRLQEDDGVLSASQSLSKNISATLENYEQIQHECQAESLCVGNLPLSTASRINEPLSWTALFTHPWSGIWKHLLWIGALLCLGSGILMVVEPEMHLFYTLLMALFIPIVVITFLWELEITRSISWGIITLTTIISGAFTIILTLLVGTFCKFESAAFAGFIEEPIKALPLFVLVFFRSSFPSLLSGICLGACVGAGFAVIETYQYAYVFGDNVMPSTFILLIRGALSPFMHIAWTAALGGALWSARGEDRGGEYAFTSCSPWLVLGAMILCHCFWNFAMETGLQDLTRFSSIFVWWLIFTYITKGVKEALSHGYLPKGI